MSGQRSEIKIFTGTYGQPFAKRMCEYLGIELGESYVKHFSEGNIFVKIQEKVRGLDVYFVESMGLDPNNSFTEILFWMDAFKRASAKSVTCIMPYFSYAKGDKKDEPRVSIRARVCAECLELAGADRLIMMDLHSPQVQGFFKVPLDHIYAMPILCEYAKKLNMIKKDTVIVSPDAGFAKSARKYCEYLNLSFALGEKIRRNHEEDAKCVNIFGDVEGKDCIIVDDFSLSGRTLREVAVTLKSKGAKDIYVFLSHIALSREGANLLQDEPAIKKVIGTDSIINDNILGLDKIEVISAAPIFAEAIYRIHNQRSLGSMFKKIPTKVLEVIEKI